MNASAGLLAKMADCIADCVRLAVPQETEWEHSGNQSRRAHRTVGRTPGDKLSFLDLRDRVAPVGPHRLQVWHIYSAAQIDIVAEVGGSDWLASVGLKLFKVGSVDGSIAVHVGC
jgi:hypothetical protein